MGKLGGGELNFSSDIDLIFTFPENGYTVGGRELANQQFFIKLGQRLINALHQPTQDGQVFRVDMRLRPLAMRGRSPSPSPLWRTTTSITAATGSATPWSRRGCWAPV